PLDPPAIAQFLGPGNGLISKVRVSNLDRTRDAIDFVAATVDASGLVEHAIFGEDLVDGRAPPSTRSSPKIACSTSPEASTVAATKSIASRVRSRLLTLTFDINPLPGPRNWAMAGGSNGYRAALVRRRLTLGLISSLPATAGLPPFISFSTSYPELYPELDSAVRRPMRRIGNGGGNISRSPKLPCSWFGGCDEG